MLIGTIRREVEASEVFDHYAFLLSLHFLLKNGNNFRHRATNSALNNFELARYFLNDFFELLFSMHKFSLHKLFFNIDYSEEQAVEDFVAKLETFRFNFFHIMLLVLERDNFVASKGLHLACARINDNDLSIKYGRPCLDIFANVASHARPIQLSVVLATSGEEHHMHVLQMALDALAVELGLDEDFSLRCDYVCKFRQ